jgi:SWI/SNF-related matrix-associated actin-dependent regulator of chromatin subfamily D
MPSAGPAAWIVRVEGRLEALPGAGAAAAPASSRSANKTATAAAANSAPMQPPRKFSHFLRSLLVEQQQQCIEWTRQGSLGTTSVNCDGFEIRRPLPASSGNGGESENLQFKIHLQFNFAPEKYRLAPELAALLSNLTLATKPAIILALWQYIKLHKLQENDEKKIINNDAALQGLFNCEKMSFSEIPVLLEPFLLPPEPLCIPFTLLGLGSDTTVSPVVVEVEVDVDDPKQGPPRSLIPPQLARDLAFHDGRIRELLEAMHVSKNNLTLLKAFAHDPLLTTQSLLSASARDYETLLGDAPVSLDELRSAEFYTSDAVEQAVHEFLSLNPRYLQF